MIAKNTTIVQNLDYHIARFAKMLEGQPRGFQHARRTMRLLQMYRAVRIYRDNEKELKSKLDEAWTGFKANVL